MIQGNVIDDVFTDPNITLREAKKKLSKMLGILVNVWIGSVDNGELAYIVFDCERAQIIRKVKIL